MGYGGGGLGLLLVVVMMWMMFRLVMRSGRGTWGGGPWRGGPWGGSPGRGPYGGGGWPGSNGPRNPQAGGQGGGPTWTGGQGDSGGQGPTWTNGPSSDNGPTWTGGQGADPGQGPTSTGGEPAARQGTEVWRSDNPLTGGPAEWSADGGPAGGGWASPRPGGGDSAVPAASGRGVGERLSGTGGAWPDDNGGSWDEWMSDERPAAASIPAELFPQHHARAVQAESPVDVGLAAIKAHDPGFDLLQFTEQVQRVFFLVEQAWSERKPEVTRQVMADDLWVTHRAQIQGYVDARKRNMVDYLAVSNIWPVAASSGPDFDTITVRVEAASTDYDVEDASGRVLRGDRQVKPWEEDWTFRRSSSARTKKGGTTLGSKCPNCGAPLDADIAGVCPYCKASVIAGTHDWVLAHISQVG